jgi:hypothetical protein
MVRCRQGDKYIHINKYKYNHINAQHGALQAYNLASSLSDQGKHTEAVQLSRETLKVKRRVFGEEHHDFLASKHNLATALLEDGKYAEAEQLNRELLGVRKRVLGAEHPNTLNSATNLAVSIGYQNNFAEAEQMLKTTLASCHRVLGPAHSITQLTAGGLEDISERAKMARWLESLPAHEFSRMASLHGTKAPAPVRLLPAGTRVLVQRLVAKPEHNGKRARVLSFDACSGRYAVALDDGKDLSLKLECVARAGCAAVGCATEEAGNVCARCEAVRYCSRDCQRADWRAHKPACMAAHSSAKLTRG